MADTAPLVFTFSQVVPNAAAAADAVTVVAIAPFAGTISRVAYVADTALTGANTDSRTGRLHNRGAAGAGTTVVASKAFVNGVNAAQYDETAITLSGTAADLVVAQGDVLTWESLHVGATGLADPGGTVFVDITRS